jgi:hypothetical protein
LGRTGYSKPSLRSLRKANGRWRDKLGDVALIGVILEHVIYPYRRDWRLG